MHLFFDLDHTLWDFDTNADECLTQIFDEFLPKESHKKNAFTKQFSMINRAMWLQLERNEITHDFLRKNRFKNTFEAIELKINEAVGEEMNEHFLDLLPEKVGLMEHAIEILEYLQPHHNLHILSNGFFEIQKRKIHNSGLSPYIDFLITNDLAGARKPDAEIFQYALNQTGANLENSMMIGDSFEADIKGAEQFGLKSIYFAPTNYHNHSRYINSLQQLKNYF